MSLWDDTIQEYIQDEVDNNGVERADFERVLDKVFGSKKPAESAPRLYTEVLGVSIPEGAEFETWTNDVFTFRLISDFEHSYLVETKIANSRGTSIGYRQFDTLSDLYDDLEARGARIVE